MLDCYLVHLLGGNVNCDEGLLSTSTVGREPRVAVSFSGPLSSPYGFGSFGILERACMVADNGVVTLQER